MIQQCSVGFSLPEIATFGSFFSSAINVYVVMENRLEDILVIMHYYCHHKKLKSARVRMNPWYSCNVVIFQKKKLSILL